jgi:uncharacterized membrane protein (DUF485 family)
MDKSLVEKIKSNPAYNELITKRSSLAWKLTIAILVVYYAFILLIAFSPETLGTSLNGGMTTVGIPVGMAIIVFAFVITGVYVKKANSEFDDLTKKIKDDIAKEMK